MRTSRVVLLGGGRMRYSPCLPHWSVAERGAREKTGFHDGGGRSADRLAAGRETLMCISLSPRNPGRTQCN